MRYIDGSQHCWKLLSSGEPVLLRIRYSNDGSIGARLSRHVVNRGLI